MRKGPLWTMAALLVLSLALLIGASLSLGRQKEQIDWSVTVLEGDPAAAAGVTLTLRLQDTGGNLLWDSVLTMDPEGFQADTGFTYRLDPPKRSVTEVQRSYVHTFSGGGSLYIYDADKSPDQISKSQATHWGLPWDAILDVLSRTPEGETVTETVDLSDYYEAFPIVVTGEAMSYGTASEIRLLAPTLGPMPEGTDVEITVGRHSDLEISIMTSSDTMWPSITSLPWGDGFLVYAHMGDRMSHDAPMPSDVPLSQGICYLSTQGDGALTLRLPLDLSRVEILETRLGQDDRLQVWLRENGTLVLLIADPDTGEILQRLDLLSVSEDSYLSVIQEEANCLFTVMGNGDFCLLERGADGALSPALKGRPRSTSGDEIRGAVVDALTRYGSNILWDGERLIWTAGSQYYYYPMDIVPLAVYDRTGPLCLAVLECGLFREPTEEEGYYSFQDQDPITLS